MRKITQAFPLEGAIIALCDDGTLWGLEGGRWNKLEPIPQDAQSDTLNAWETLGGIWALFGDALPMKSLSPEDARRAHLDGYTLVEASSANVAERIFRERRHALNLRRVVFPVLQFPYLTERPL